jgi:Ala-tRNA(Pro) deacylase
VNPNQEKLFALLKELNIETQTIHHEPMFTCEQSQSIAHLIPAAQCKNLFLKDSKKRLWLISALQSTAINLKKIAKQIQAPELRFADAELLKAHLCVLPGSVTPFGIINDNAHNVTLVLDANLMNEKIVSFHPLENNATTCITPSDLQKFIAACGNPSLIVELSYDTQ